MGTGIVATILHEFSTIYPRYHSSVKVLSIIFFVLNVFLFTLISLITLLRYALYPATWILMLRHPVQSLFLGTIPMGFATIVNMFTVHCAAEWGGASTKIAWAMWWVDAIVSVGCCAGLPFQMYVMIHASIIPPTTKLTMAPLTG
jgi:tellurite resistance protein TehA-like permease